MPNPFHKLRLPSKEEMAEKAVNKMLKGKAEKMPLAKQVKLTEKFMYMYPGGMPAGRGHFLKDGFPKDIKDWASKGKSEAEIKDYYWSCEEFKAFWGRIGMTEGMLDDLIHDTLEVAGAKA